jgi:hypothetical protein
LGTLSRALRLAYVDWLSWRTARVAPYQSSSFPCGGGSGLRREDFRNVNRFVVSDDPEGSFSTYESVLDASPTCCRGGWSTLRSSKAMEPRPKVLKPMHRLNGYAAVKPTRRPSLVVIVSAYFLLLNRVIRLGGSGVKKGSLRRLKDDVPAGLVVRTNPLRWVAP